MLERPARPTPLPPTGLKTALLETAMWNPALRACALALAALPALACAALPLATATILDGGDVVVIRESAVVGLVEGMRLQKDDIVHTGTRTRFVRLEFNDGLVLDVAGDTRLMLSPKAGADRGREPPRVYLLQGTVKVGAPAGPPTADTVLASRELDVSAVAKGLVVAITPEATAVFAESGGATLVERRELKPQPPQTLRNGQFFSRGGDGKAQVTARPSGAFIQTLPKAFLDTLPSRLAVFKGREVAPKPLPAPLAYDMVQPWIDAEPALRPQFVPRWRALAKVPEFRAGLVAGIASHPEWDRLLFPEKYRPKPPPPAAASYPAARP